MVYKVQKCSRWPSNTTWWNSFGLRAKDCRAIISDIKKVIKISIGSGNTDSGICKGICVLVCAYEIQSEWVGESVCVCVGGESGCWLVWVCA
jgi:hypothetical protein